MVRDEAQFAQMLEREVQHRLEQLERRDTQAAVERMDASPVWVTTATVVAIVIIFIISII